MLKLQAEFTNMLIFDRNYWTSGRVDREGAYDLKDD